MFSTTFIVFNKKIIVKIDYLQNATTYIYRTSTNMLWLKQGAFNKKVRFPKMRYATFWYTKWAYFLRVEEIECLFLKRWLMFYKMKYFPKWRWHLCYHFSQRGGTVHLTWIEDRLLGWAFCWLFYSQTLFAAQKMEMSCWWHDSILDIGWDIAIRSWVASIKNQ